MPLSLSRLTLGAFSALLATAALTFVVRSDAAPRSTPLDAVAAAVQDNEKGDEPNPKLLVGSVDEPDVSLEGKVADREDFVAPIQGGGFIFERRDVDGKRIGGVVVPGVVLVTKGLVELFGCGEGGKEHETVIRLESNVQALDLALTSAGFKRGRLPVKTDITLPEQGTRLLILVQWLDKNGKLVTHRSEDLVVSMRRNSPMPRVGWTYVGNWIDVADPTSPKGEKKSPVLAANGSRSFVATFRDRTALLDNPLEEAVDDTLFGSNYMLLPRTGTPVRVILRAPTAAERAEIGALEKRLAAEAKIELHKGKSREESGK